jgi:ectoine hydroxylase-related dioxygenase (phytanoyl-CoA dioxygenase family)
MNKKIIRPIRQDEVEQFDHDGVILLKEMFDSEWISSLSQGLDKNIELPSTRSRVWDRDENGRTMFYDAQAWQQINEYQNFIFNSPAAAIAGKLMKSSKINLYFDAVFVRSPGSQFATPWHQDEPYWSVEGYNTCTIWMPLVPVKRENALSFVPGSHRFDSTFYQFNFGSLNPDEINDVDETNFEGITDVEFPDIAADPEKYGVVSWDMNPGDCIAFNSRIMHGGSGKLDENTELRVFTSKWIGDDVFIKFRECGMDPDHSEVMIKQGLKPGDRPGTELYPEIHFS